MEYVQNKMNRWVEIRCVNVFVYRYLFVFMSAE